ncbi:MAG: bifunctional hydroxymethylpyrimidine kinase/phosphomethylpyrimidine kinase [Rubritepida sp.]|nr:bifunctional hydroxymethylpyrimidine kinase/phosphomethylpyrimidine kinase [Rubritepida sp.]
MPKKVVPTPDRPAVSLPAAVRLLRRGSLLVVGDAMLDRYVYGRVSRVSPEAPVPVLAVERELALPGGAGNVVRNLTALGAAVAFVSVVGDDQPGSELTGLIGGQLRVEPWLLVQGGRATTTKTRFVASGQHIMRADHEQAGPIHPRLADRLVRIATDAIAATSVVVLSDYQKGVLSGDVAPRIIAAARAAGRRVVVDPRGGALARFAGADLIVPDPEELALATGLPVGTAAELTAAALSLKREMSFGAVLVPRGPEGLTLVHGPVGGESEVLQLRAEACDQHDPAGAGDAVVAVLAASLAAGLSIVTAAELAAVAIGIVTRKAGIAVVRDDELLEALTPGLNARRKLVTVPLASETVERWRHRGWRIGLLHLAAGGAAVWDQVLMEQARGWCDRLLVVVQEPAGQGGDEGSGEGGGKAMADWPAVDLLASCDGQTNEALLRLFRPDVLVNGPQAMPLGMDDENLLAEWGGKLLRAELAQAAE